MSATMVQHEVISLLLGRGTDPSHPRVMLCAMWNTPEALQLVLDAGGDPNAATGSDRPIFAALRSVWKREEKLRLLLQQPTLDLTLRNDVGETAEQNAWRLLEPGLATAIAVEVSRRVVWCGVIYRVGRACVVLRQTASDLVIKYFRYSRASSSVILYCLCVCGQSACRARWSGLRQAWVTGVVATASDSSLDSNPADVVNLKLSNADQ